MSQFPFATTLDLSTLVDYWREHASDPASRWHSMAATVLDRVSDVPELNGPVDDASRLEPVRGETDLLMSAFMSPSSNGLVAAAMVPWRPELPPVYTTEMAGIVDMHARIVDHWFATYDAEEIAVSLSMKAYGYILKEVYGLDLGFELPFSWVSFRDVESTIPLECPMSGITRRMAIDIDPRFVRVEVVGERPEISEEEIAHLIGDPNALPRLLELLPPEHFAFRGVIMMFGEDVTEEAALTAIRDDLLLKDALTSRDGILHIQEHVRAFMGRNDLELGLIGIEPGSNGIRAVEDGQVIGRSLLMTNGFAPVCSDRAESLYARAVETREPVVVDDLMCCEAHTKFEQRLREQGLRAVMVLPLYVDGELTGMLELGSRTVGALSAVNVFRLEKIQGLFALGLRRSMEEREDRVQAIIKRDYTAIHPVVEWRFREAAREHLRRQAQGDMVQAEEIVFNDLSPLYGLTDIRGSSNLRNAAIVADLRDQLELAHNVVLAAQAVRAQPALGEIEYRLTRYLETLHPGMATEDESSVLSYLQVHVEPLFDNVTTLGASVEHAIREYRDAIDPTLGILYRKRRDFERSVGSVNETIAAVLRDAEVEGQELVPHYFELFKTDGVDYNVYSGASLHRDRPHDSLDLRNLRLWQLLTTIKIEWELDAARESWEVPLEVTHLILAQNTPLAIRFRRDERRFDVDGAYNIRYEIVKKRIDKAHVLGTGERLTQPGTIAIAYSQEREATEYRRYLEYLQSMGYIEDEIEAFELEDLQGVFGLKALRARIIPRTEATSDLERAAQFRAVAPTLALEA